MTWSPFLRAVGISPRRRRAHAQTAAARTAAERRARHSAMGLDVPPVHGWHCICERSQRPLVVLTVLGGGGWLPAHGRHTAAALMRQDEAAIMIDAGTGVSRLIE